MGEEGPARLTRRRLMVLGGGLALAVTVPRVPRALAAVDPGVPTWESVNGFALGSRQASAKQLDDYLLAVDKASPRVQSALLSPPTVQGRPLRYAVISSPENLARLDEIEKRTRALRLTPPNAAERAKAAKELPAFVLMVANVHGNEPSGAEGFTQLLYELAARDDEANVKRLRELVVVMAVSQNPDGREMGHRVNANGFDLNRDWFAMTQPETIGKVGLYVRFPPVLGIDAHEQFASAPDTFFFPPDNDPVHHESSRPGLKASDEIVTPRLEQAFKDKGYRWEHYGIYDVFYPGYGDCAPNQAFGAAGVLFEMENSGPYPEKFARQFTASDAAVNAIADNKELVLRRWADQWPEAAAQGGEGRLAPNFIQNPENGTKPQPVPDERIYGYAIRTTARAADAALIADRLRRFDVAVHVLTRPVSLKRLRPFGGGAFGPARLGRGTLIVTASQPLKHWAHILLADDPFPAVNYFYDVSGWSNPAMAGLSGGAIGEPLTAILRRPRDRKRVATAKAIKRAADLQRPLKRATAYTFALDAALAQAAAFHLLADGVALRRTADGAAVVPGSARSAVEAAGRRFGIRARGLSTAPGDLVAARRPKVALLRDAAATQAEVLFASSRGFARWLLADRFGLKVTEVTTADVEGGALKDHDAFVVPEGLSTVIPAGYPNVALSPPGGGFTPAGLAAVQSYVTGGGTFIGYRVLGVAVATGAGIAGDLRTKRAPDGFVVPGAPVGLELRGTDAAVRGLGARAFAFNVGDPILEGGEATFARYPDKLNVLGYAEKLEAVNGTVAGTVARVGKGRAYVMSFDPGYRGFVEGTQRLVGNMLLEAAPAAGGGAPRDVSLARAAQVVAPARHILIRVAPGDAAALATAAAASAPADAVLAGAELRALDPDPLSGHAAAWADELLRALRRAGVTPTLVIA